MNGNEILWIMWFYIGSQYLFSRYAARELNREDPDYFNLKSPGGKFTIGMKTSLSVTGMIFDTDLPSSDYSKALKNKIYVARLLFAMTVPLLFLLLFI
ncbi:hypothetical protein EAH75_08410 [Rhodanobacter glycinis]|uniref:Uncharacterized protein n=1 Tax=Rhodanobacter glycinis TaxID=582702 RepID=A0A502BVM5_9GAMM|nr:hypothetical protein EAH88_19020 [Rhodanobacter glycinis]TPG48473.1 hypothetical protein EAH75_08410 [Rhodanobacter glycinis]